MTEHWASLDQAHVKNLPGATNLMIYLILFTILKKLQLDSGCSGQHLKVLEHHIS